MKSSTKNLLSKRKVTRILLISFVVFILGIAGTYFATLAWIHHDASAMAKEASIVFKKDKIESLLEVIESEDYSLKEKNKAVWALGVLKDKRALPRLEALHTAKECNHEEELCQYEIKKAILKIKREFRGSWQASSD